MTEMDLQEEYRSIFRDEIVRHSIRILRSRGKKEEQIRQKMLKDFVIAPETLNRLTEE